jgi:hypothetical protein
LVRIQDTTNHVFSKYIETGYLRGFVTKREAFAMLFINSMNNPCSNLAANGVVICFILRLQRSWKDAYSHSVCLPCCRMLR